MRATFARVYFEILRKNIRSIRKFIRGGARLCVAVKADAYGHGAVRCARVMQEEGVEAFAVATVSEGAELRQAGISLPVLLLSYCCPEEAELAVRNDLEPFVGDSEYAAHFAEAARRLGKTARVHIAVDTGMGRVGCLPEEAAPLARRLSAMEGLSIAGTCTHFAVADSLSQSDREYTQMQLSLLNQAVESIRAAGIDPGIRHCANSAAIFDLPESHLDMVRCGISAYGYYPGEISAEYLESKGSPAEIEPFMSLVTRVSAVRQFEEGKSVSYGREWTASGRTDVAVLPVGYADGLLRRHAKSLRVSIGGRAYPVCGRICMDQCMVDLGEGSGVSRWDEAVVFGPKSSGAAQSAQDLADAAGTISYEVTCAVSARVPRIYV